MITVSALTYYYPAKKALDNVSFSLTAGAVTALVGPNGAGKTTLLRCMAALDTPYSGRVVIDGRDVAEYPRECHARIGYLSDSFGLYDDLLVRQCLAHAASMHGLRGLAEKARVNQIADQLGITNLLSVRAGSLSRGQRQRIGIAQALIHEPKVVLLDEPAAGLDPAARFELSELVQTLKRSGRTLLISSHILSELQDYSDEMLTLSNGKILGHVKVAGGTSHQARLLELQVAGDLDQTLDFLRSLPEVASPKSFNGRILISIPNEDTVQVALLGKVVAQGIPLLSFKPVTTDMQSVYLAQVNPTGEA